MPILKIENLHVEIEEKEILKGINLEIDTGKINALMGTNGSGKTTLAQTIMGHPKYKITKGKIIFNKIDITNSGPDERSRLGLFLSFQHPQAIEGIKIIDLIKQAIKERKQKKSTIEIKKESKEKQELLEIDETLFSRSINNGFSGGEKKKMEIYQMLMLNPKLAILDETDSGLDIDSLKIISKGINNFLNEKKSILIITHYKRILEHINPDKVFIMKNGKIIKEGDFSIVEKLEKEGYKFLDKE